MERDNPQYRKQRMLWEFSQSRVWVEYLKPYLIRKAESPPIPLLQLEAAFKTARQQGAMALANSLLQEVEYCARQFSERQQQYQKQADATYDHNANQS